MHAGLICKVTLKGVGLGVRYLRINGLPRGTVNTRLQMLGLLRLCLAIPTPGFIGTIIVKKHFLSVESVLRWVGIDCTHMRRNVCCVRLTLTMIV